MESSKFKHNPTALKSAVFKTDDNQLVTKKPLDIYFPSDYIPRQLAVIGRDVLSIGIFIVVDENFNYTTSLVPSLITLGPGELSDVLIDNDEYTKISFDAGDVMFKSTALPKEKKITNAILDYFYDYAYTPWFISAIHLAEILSECDYFNGITLGQNQIVRDVIAGTLCRSPDDPKVYYRSIITKVDQLYKHPQVIGHRDINLVTTSGLAKINGAELKRSLKGALLVDPVRPDPLEQLIMEG